MFLNDLTLGTIFTYRYINNFQKAIGEVTKVENGFFTIKWLWSPNTGQECNGEYSTASIRNWIEFCDIITAQEKLVLMLKNNYE